MNKHIKAFTLVELIVVIVILAILGTISFISLQGYSSAARGSKRLSDVRGLELKIITENAKGVSMSELLSNKSGTTITINGEPKEATIGVANFEVLKENSGSFQDPSTKEDYKVAYAVGTYTTDDGKEQQYNFYQLAYKEETTNTIRCIGNYYKINQNDSGDLFDGICGENNIKNNDEDLNGALVMNCNGASTSVITANTRYQGCDTNDILVCTGIGTGKIISACNVGASVAGIHSLCDSKSNTTYSNCTPEKVGYHFQWGNNHGFPINEITLSNVSTERVNTEGYGNGVYYSSGTYIIASSDNWTDPVNNNLWNSTTANQGPCANGYHIPSHEEWSSIGNVWGWSIAEVNKMRTALFLPLTGAREGRASSNLVLNNNNHYWASDSRSLRFTNVGNINYGSTSKSSAFAVRCIKNY